MMPLHRSAHWLHEISIGGAQYDRGCTNIHVQHTPIELSTSRGLTPRILLIFQRFLFTLTIYHFKLAFSVNSGNDVEKTTLE